MYWYSAWITSHNLHSTPRGGYCCHTHFTCGETEMQEAIAVSQQQSWDSSVGCLTPGPHMNYSPLWSPEVFSPWRMRSCIYFTDQ